MFCIFGAVVLIANIYSNSDIIDIEVQYGYSITVGWFVVLSLIIAVLSAHMTYKPYVIDRAGGNNVILYALIFYILTYIIWATTLFNSRTNRGVPGLASLFLLATTIWLGWSCYNLYPDTIYIFLILLAWSLFIIEYTFNVESHPWTVA
jgi:hypothetical protein